MKRVKKRSKKRDESNEENDPFSMFPLDLKVEILMKLPPSSIARLGFVSDHWSSIIRGKAFTDLYLTRSSTQPRLLFSVFRGGDMFFTSYSQEDPSSDHRTVSYTLNSNLPYTFSPPIRGLICGRNSTRVIIGNPSTGQFVLLPRVKTRKKDILSVFGYDPVNDLYKVLCITTIFKRLSRHVGMRDVFLEDVMADEAIMSEEHQVITLGAKEKWRMIECKYPHRHYSESNGICRDGVLYYLASFNQKRSLMSFDMSSEEFSVTKLPEDYHLQEFGNLVDHTGKITIASQAYNGPIDLWVLEDAKKEVWSKAAAVVPSCQDVFGSDQRAMFRGILRTGEIIFAPLPSPNPFFFLCYDPKEKKARKVVIERIGDVSAAYVQVFFDHVESHMLV